MKITKITIKAYSNGRDITNIWGYYFDEENNIHDIDHTKAVIWDIDELIDMMDTIAMKIDPEYYEKDTINGTEGNEFTRTYKI